jgi:peptide/nickel transport system substrate-binding protein
MINPLDLSSTQPITRRRMLSGSAAATALLLAGCSSAAKSSGSGGGAAGASGAKGTLTVGTATDLAPTTLLRAGTDETSAGLIFDTLAVLDPSTFTAKPSVATSWSWNGDKTVLTVDLRSDVRYHTGRTLTPEDVIFSVKTVASPAAGAQVAGLATQIGSVVKSGAHQVKFTLPKPLSSFTDLLVMTPLVDRETYKQVASGKKIVGTGPFIFESWTPGTSSQFKGNPHYWGGAPSLKAVTVRVFGSEQALVSAMRAGELDLAWNLVPSDAALLAKSGSHPSYTSAPLFSEWFVGANVTAAPFTDLKVRQAVAYALDRERIAKQAFAGLGTASCLPWRPSAPGLTSADATYYSYDPAKAKAMFKEAGSPSQTIPILVSAGNPISAAILNIAEYNLSQVGFKVKGQEVQATTYATDLEDAKIPGLFVSSVGQVDLSVATVLLGNSPFKVAQNTSAVTAPEYKTLAGKLIYAASDSEIAAATQAVTHYILEQAWHLTVGHVPIVAARTPKLSGVSTTAALNLDLMGAKLT